MNELDREADKCAKDLLPINDEANAVVPRWYARERIRLAFLAGSESDQNLRDQLTAALLENNSLNEQLSRAQSLIAERARELEAIKREYFEAGRETAFDAHGWLRWGTYEEYERGKK